jgi:hypothetical protein
MNFLARWRPYHLLLAWGTYWIVLLAFAVGPAIPAILRATRSEDNHGEISASFSNTVLNFVVREMGQITWTGSVHLLAAALWVAVPPLVLWALWLRARGSATRPERELLTY